MQQIAIELFYSFRVRVFFRQLQKTVCRPTIQFFSADILENRLADQALNNFVQSSCASICLFVIQIHPKKLYTEWLKLKLKSGIFPKLLICFCRRLHRTAFQTTIFVKLGQEVLFDLFLAHG